MKRIRGTPQKSVKRKRRSLNRGGKQKKVKVEPVDQFQSETVEEVPAESLSEVPVKNVTEVPMVSIGKVPVENVREVPAKKLDEISQEQVEKMDCDEDVKVEQNEEVVENVVNIEINSTNEIAVSENLTNEVAQSSETDKASDIEIVASPVDEQTDAEDNAVVEPETSKEEASTNSNSESSSLNSLKINEDADCEDINRPEQETFAEPSPPVLLEVEQTPTQHDKKPSASKKMNAAEIEKEIESLLGVCDEDTTSDQQDVSEPSSVIQGKKEEVDKSFSGNGVSPQEELENVGIKEEESSTDKSFDKVRNEEKVEESEKEFSDSDESLVFFDCQEKFESKSDDAGITVSKKNLETVDESTVSENAGEIVSVFEDSTGLMKNQEETEPEKTDENISALEENLSPFGILEKTETETVTEGAHVSEENGVKAPEENYVLGDFSSLPKGQMSLENGEKVPGLGENSAENQAEAADKKSVCKSSSSNENSGSVSKVSGVLGEAAQNSVVLESKNSGLSDNKTSAVSEDTNKSSVDSGCVNSKLSENVNSVSEILGDSSENAGVSGKNSGASENRTSGILSDAIKSSGILEDVKTDNNLDTKQEEEVDGWSDDGSGDVYEPAYEWEVDYICDKKLIENITYYKVKWKGYDELVVYLIIILIIICDKN